MKNVEFHRFSWFGEPCPITWFSDNWTERNGTFSGAFSNETLSLILVLFTINVKMVTYLWCWWICFPYFYGDRINSTEIWQSSMFWSHFRRKSIQTIVTLFKLRNYPQDRFALEINTISTFTSSLYRLH